MQLLCREQRKILAQIKPRLCAEDRQRTDPGAIVARLALFENESQKIVILPHMQPLTHRSIFAKTKKRSAVMAAVPAAWFWFEGTRLPLQSSIFANFFVRLARLQAAACARS